MLNSQIEKHYGVFISDKSSLLEKYVLSLRLRWPSPSMSSTMSPLFCGRLCIDIFALTYKTEIRYISHVRSERPGAGPGISSAKNRPYGCAAVKAG